MIFLEGNVSSFSTLWAKGVDLEGQRVTASRVAQTITSLHVGVRPVQQVFGQMITLLLFCMTFELLWFILHFPTFPEDIHVHLFFFFYN